MEETTRGGEDKDRNERREGEEWRYREEEEEGVGREEGREG